MRSFTIICSILIAATCGYAFHIPCTRIKVGIFGKVYGDCEHGYVGNIGAAYGTGVAYQPQLVQPTDIVSSGRPVVQIVNGNSANSQVYQQQQHPGLIENYPAVGYNAQQFGSSGSVAGAAASASASASSSSWNQNNGQLYSPLGYAPAGASVAHSNSMSWSASSSRKA